MAKAAFLYLLVALPSARAGESCTKEQYAAKFGAPYTLHALGDAQPPAIEGGAHVVLDVSYSTPCKGGGSSFQGTLVDKFGSSVLIVARDEPECGAEGEALFASEWRGLVAVRLPENFTAAAPEEDLGEPSFASPRSLWLLSSCCGGWRLRGGGRRGRAGGVRGPRRGPRAAPRRHGPRPPDPRPRAGAGGALQRQRAGGHSRRGQSGAGTGRGAATRRVRSETGDPSSPGVGRVIDPPGPALGLWQPSPAALGE